MTALEKFNQFRRVDRIQMEQEIVLRQKLIAHGTEIDRIKKAIKPDNRQQEKKKTETNKKEGIFRIIGTQNSRFYIIRPEEGKFIKTVAREQILVTAKGEYLLKNSLSYWEERLKDYGWFRCHKGFLINLNEIEEVYPMFNYTYNIRMKGFDEEVLVSRTYVKEFKELLNM